MAKLSKAEFKKVQDYWYQRLADEGFVDIENSSKKQDPFRIPHRHDKTFQNSQVWADSKKEYYEFAAYFLSDYAFELALDQTIWEYHVNLITVRGIAKVLSGVGIKIAKSSVHRKIKELQEIMKEKYNVGTKSK